MALKDTWVNKVDGVDISSANDINEVAQAVIDLENESGSRPDFAANEGEKGFIKNRTHYIDKDGKVHTLPIEFIPEGVAKEKYVDDSIKALFVPRRLSEMVSDKYHRTVSDEEKEKWNAGGESVLEEVETYTANTTIVISQQSLSSGMWMNRKQDIEPGIPYAVYIGGKEYFCIAGNEDGTIYLGNPKLFDSASTQAHNNEPFCITWAGGAATAGMFFKDSTLSYPLTLKVTGAAVTTEKKLPRKYLPDDVAMKSDIPEGGGGANIDVVASVGQTIVVEKVDADGKPTKWKAAEFQPRTHWTDVVEILPETTGEVDAEMGLVLLPDITLEADKEYTVKYNGVEYVSTCIATDAGNMIGNIPLLMETGDNGQPFVVAYEGVWLCIPLDGSTSITLSIKETVVTQIPKEYIPSKAVVIDADATNISTSRVLKLTGIDTTDIVNAIFNNEPIYVNLHTYSVNNSYYECETLPAFVKYGSVYDDDLTNLTTAKDYYKKIIGGGGYPISSVPCTLNVYSLSNKEVYQIAINQTYD